MLFLPHFYLMLSTVALRHQMRCNLRKHKEIEKAAKAYKTQRKFKKRSKSFQNNNTEQN